MKNNFLCKVFGHHLVSIKKATLLIKEYECEKCHQKFTTDGYGHIVKLSKYWEENNLIFENKFQNKTAG